MTLGPCCTIYVVVTNSSYKKAHSSCSVISAEICAGTVPLNLFKERYLQCKLAEYMLIKKVLSSQHPSLYHLKHVKGSCTRVKKAHNHVNLVRAEISKGICEVKALPYKSLHKHA